MTGVGHGLHQRPIVGEQQQSLTVLVQPSHRKDPDAAVRHQLSGGGAAQLIAEGGHITTGFIEHQVHHRFGKRQRLSVHGDSVRLRIGLIAQPGRSAVDRHPSLRQQRFRRPTGAKAGAGDQFLQPFRHDASSVFFVS